ncbi:MAG: hypothetical protein ACOVP4_00135 [Bacteriovoracaceae bacterium]
MKLAILGCSLMMSSPLWANPMLLSCVINKQTITLNVESLISDDCLSKTFPVINGQLQTRYNITVCHGDSVEGTIEVKTKDGWYLVENISTQDECRLFRRVISTRTCPRFSHQCGEI